MSEPLNEERARDLSDVDDRGRYVGYLECIEQEKDLISKYAASNAALIEALKAQMTMRNVAKPMKLDEALSWRENDDLANRLATEALSSAAALRGEKGGEVGNVGENI